jgi:hypothetical protein
VVSEAHGTRRQRQVEGSTLADRQAARRDYDVLRNRSQAASRAGTAGGTPQPGRMETSADRSGSPIGEGDLRETGTTGGSEDGELPGKRPKLTESSTNDKVDKADKVDSDEEGALPTADTVGPPPDTATSSFGERMLSKMGLAPGQGLGKNQQGQVEALRLSEQYGNSGIGFDAYKTHDVHQGIPDTPWFERTDAPNTTGWVLGPVELLSPAIVADWSIVEAPLTALTLSKFCRSSVLYQLQVQRLDNLGTLHLMLTNASSSPHVCRSSTRSPGQPHTRRASHHLC